MQIQPSYNICCCLVFALHAALVCVFLALPAVGQEITDAYSASLASGTLNLILADKNGFVVATDSRMSSLQPFECRPGLPKRRYCDDSQKLFRTGKHSAMVIAGFAAGRATTRSPLDLMVASVLRQNFSPCGQKIFQVTTGPAPTAKVICAPEEMSGPVSGLFNLPPALTAVASLYDPEQFSPDQMRLTASWASIDDHGRVFIQQQYFNVTWMYTNHHVPVPVYRVSRTPGDVVDRFYPVAEGINDIAFQILGGTYKSSDPIIKRYYRKLNAGPSGRDSMSLGELDDLARAILRETKKSTWLVGGPDQIGIFPVKGQPVIAGLSRLPTDKQLASRFLMNSCFDYVTNDRRANGPCLDGSFREDFTHSLDEVIPQFFLGCTFSDVSVSLDNNYFIRSDFDGVIFKYAGKKTPFIFKSSLKNCAVEVPEGVVLDIPDVASNCRKVDVKSITLDKDTIGSPVQYQRKGASISLPIPR